MSFLRDPKRFVATLIAGVAGLIVLIDFSSSIAGIDQVARLVLDWAALLAAMALLVGLAECRGRAPSARAESPGRLGI